MNADLVHEQIENVVRTSWGRVLAVLMKQLRDFELAEDVLQEALLTALAKWPQSGIPHVPEAWLLAVAKRKAIDRLRHLQMHKHKTVEIAMMTSNDLEIDSQGEIEDERLGLIFTCAHPALSSTARIALTLKAVGGLSVAEIARALMATESTISQRIVRAKRKIKLANIPYKVPERPQWSARLQSVLDVIYFIFNEGYTATSGAQLSRGDLCVEAQRLASAVHKLLPEETEAAGLFALILLHEARRTSRCDKDDNLVQLEDQDRSLWDSEKIRQGSAILINALSRGQIGPCQLQAAISAVHANAASFKSTDWREITALYGKLYELTPTPVVRLNAIVALSFARGPKEGLTALQDLEQEGKLDHYHHFHVVKADLLARLHRPRRAKTCLLRALELTTNQAERHFLERKLLQLPDRKTKN